MKYLFIFLTFFLLFVPCLAQPTPQPTPSPVPRHHRPDTVSQPSPAPDYIPLDAAAAPCQLTVSNAPSLYGVKLGLTPDELGKAFKIKITPGVPNKLEVSTFEIGEKNKSALPNGINYIKLAFFNNHLFYAQIYFDNSVPKQPADKFALALSERHGFSKAWFKTAEISDVYLFCPGEMRFTLSDRSYDALELEMLDLKADSQKNQRRQQINNTRPQ